MADIKEAQAKLGIGGFSQARFKSGKVADKHKTEGEKSRSNLPLISCI